MKSMGALRLLALAMVVLLAPNGGALTTGQNRTRGWGVNVQQLLPRYSRI